MEKIMKVFGKSRRRFLRSLAASSAALFTGRSLNGSKAPAKGMSDQPSDVGKCYRLTAHIRRYYDAARF
jgi:hypothetical protein